MEKRYRTFTLRKTEQFLRTLPAKKEAKLRAEMLIVESGDFQSSYIKTLRGPIKELIVGSYRLIFFISQDHTIYYTSAFRKKSQRTPKQEIDEAE
ncbi:MAG: type II toxin-antitoxin system RelE/ParE family toxin, partial [Candidatus Taylorbacteria bacterium]|nr:type II toxin-antitoxin system RelE/ParE family toxin [Candidatus Taylorbacteria bacterium]